MEGWGTVENMVVFNRKERKDLRKARKENSAPFAVKKRIESFIAISPEYIRKMNRKEVAQRFPMGLNSLLILTCYFLYALRCPVPLYADMPFAITFTLLGMI